MDVPLIASIHNYESPKQKQEDKSKGSGLIVKCNRGVRAVTHLLTGFIHKDFNMHLTNFGIGFTGDEINNAGVKNGGHSHLRAVVDKLQASAI